MLEVVDLLYKAHVNVLNFEQSDECINFVMICTGYFFVCIYNHLLVQILYILL